MAARRPVICVENLGKTYAGGFEALRNVNLEIVEGEIFALLGPNGAGKTTLINIVCGIVNKTSGSVTVNGYDIVDDYRKSRAQIGLVPQELSSEGYETVLDTVNFSRGLFGKAPDADCVERVLRSLSLWEKRDSIFLNLSGGMKRRVAIAKALAHEPTVLFLDEPTAGVDVELRQDMWDLVRGLRDSGVTIILTTHYIEEAEQMADRIGVVNHGEIILVQEKERLMRELGKKRLHIDLDEELAVIPPPLERFSLELGPSQRQLVYNYDTQAEHTGITALLAALADAGIRFHDVSTTQSSLEEIFVGLVKRIR
jgi:ABC-2 type transport system ATP-binding protein